MNTIKKAVSLLLTGSMLFAMIGCSKGKTTQADVASKSGITDADLTKFSELKLGEDYKDIKADIKVITPRSDLVDTDLAEYTKEFQKLYPNVNITYDAPTDYSEDMTLRLSTDDWGDVCMIPTTLDKDEFSSKLLSFGKTEDLSKQYILMDNKAYDGEVYGIPSMCNVQGVVYNKKVFEKAGIKEMPKTPDEYLDDLKQIKEKTNAVPMYTNFAAGWTMTAWDGYIAGSATGNADFKNKELVHGTNPFAKRADMTGPYAVYYTLYEAVSRGLIEDDPTTSDWEGSKGMINKGEIATMVLGSWAVSQLQEAGDNPDSIGYMPFPITVNGKQYASAGADYAYGINKKSSIDNKMASLIYVKWMIEKSGYDAAQGGISIKVGAEYPEVLKDFTGVELVIDNPAPAGEETLFNDINNDSEIGIDSDPHPDQEILEAALTKSKTLDDIMNEWNQRWTASQKKYGAL